MVESELHGEMGEKSALSAYPAHYPLGGTFADFLCWHMDYWGTRPCGDTIHNGVPWTKDEFRHAAFGNMWEEDKIRVGMRNWRGKGSAPDPATAVTIINSFFGDSPAFAQWRAEFEQAHRASKGRGKNPRTKEFPEPPPVSTSSASIPRPTPYFVGRDDERDRIVAAILSDGGVSPAILVQGGPGMGKTELTKAIAHEPIIAAHFGERRWFVRLEAAATAEAMTDAISRELGCDPKLGFEAALNYLRAERSLIVLDNLETPWESLSERSSTEAALAELAAISEVTLIASFRGFDRVGGPLWLDQPLAGMLAAEAISLFASISGNWVHNDPALNNFVNVLGGIPLAIELVARRAHGRSGLASLWSEWLRIGADFAIHPDFAAERLTSLPHSIELSLQSSRITPAAMRLFRLLGSLPAGLSFDDRETLMGDDSFKAEERLLAVGLAVENSGRTDLLPPIREYALRHHRLSSADANAVAEHYIDVAKTLGSSIGRGGDCQAVVRLEAESKNIEDIFRLRVREGRRQTIMAAAMSYYRFLFLRGLSAGLFAELADACHVDPERDIEGEANCRYIVGELALYRTQYQTANDALQQALLLYEQIENVSGQASCRSGLGDIALMRKDHKYARESYELALGLFDRAENVIGKANCIARLAELALRLKQYDEAHVLYNSGLQLNRLCQGVQGEANCLLGLGKIAHVRGTHNLAKVFLDEALTLYARTGSIHGEATCIKAFAEMAVTCADLEAARLGFERARDMFASVAALPSQAECIEGIGDVAFAQAYKDEARTLYLQALSLFDVSGEAESAHRCREKLQGFGADIERRHLSSGKDTKKNAS